MTKLREIILKPYRRSKKLNDIGIESLCDLSSIRSILPSQNRFLSVLGSIHRIVGFKFPIS